MSSSLEINHQYSGGHASRSSMKLSSARRTTERTNPTHVFFQFSSVSHEGCQSGGNHHRYIRFPYSLIQSPSRIVVFALCLMCWLSFDGSMLINGRSIDRHWASVCFFDHWGLVKYHPFADTHIHIEQCNHQHRLKCIRITEEWGQLKARCDPLSN